MIAIISNEKLTSEIQPCPYKNGEYKGSAPAVTTEEGPWDS